MSFLFLCSADRNPQPFRRALNFDTGTGLLLSKRKAHEETDTSGIKTAKVSGNDTPRRSPRQLVSSQANDAATAAALLKIEDADGQMSDSELFSLSGEGPRSGKKKKDGNLLPEVLFTTGNAPVKSECDDEEMKKLMSQRAKTFFEEKVKKMKTYLARSLNQKQCMAMKANLLKVRRALLSPTDKSPDSFFTCVGRYIPEYASLEPSEITAKLRTSLAHWVAVKRNDFTQVTAFSPRSFHRFITCKIIVGKFCKYFNVKYLNLNLEFLQ